MNVFSMVLLGISLYFLVTGALFGLKRGLIRSGLRLGMVIVSFAIAWYAKVKYVAAILDMKVDGVPLREAFTESMEIDASIIELILPLVEILLGVLLFVIVFFLLNFLTSIIFCAVGFLLPKGDRWFGLAVGLVQGDEVGAHLQSVSPVVEEDADPGLRHQGIKTVPAELHADPEAVAAEEGRRAEHDGARIAVDQGQLPLVPADQLLLVRPLA